MLTVLLDNVGLSTDEWVRLGVVCPRVKGVGSSDEQMGFSICPSVVVLRTLEICLTL